MLARATAILAELGHQLPEDGGHTLTEGVERIVEAIEQLGKPAEPVQWATGIKSQQP